MITLSFDIASC